MHPPTTFCAYSCAHSIVKSFYLVLIFLFILGSSPLQANNGEDEGLWYAVDDQGEPSVSLYYFWTLTCPNCKKAKPFLEQMEQTHPWLRIHAYELLENPENVELYQQFAGRLGGFAQAVPGFIFCRQMYLGYDNEDSMGAFLLDKLTECYSAVRDQGQLPTESGEEAPKAPISLPFIGPFDVSAMSLPALTLLIAGIDAFNPCAFFVLLFLLSLLVHAHSRTRMFIVGGVFVLFSGLAYFLFMAAWLNVFLLLGELQLLTIIAGIMAVAFATINIKDFFWFGKGVSLSIPETAKPGLFSRMRRLVNARQLSTMLVGTVTLAIVANSYELLCTVGFPMVYTRILTLKELSTTGYYLYLAFYNIVYVIPLALIVAVFTLSLGAHKLSEREGQILKLVSGLMMLGLGGLLLLAPELLNNALAALALIAFAIGASVIIVLIQKFFHGSVRNA